MSSERRTKLIILGILLYGLFLALWAMVLPVRTRSFATPVLLYHHISDNPNFSQPTNPAVSPAKFEAELRWLKENGYQSVSLDFLMQSVPFEKRPVILTFDDGYRDNFTEAFPLLQKYGFSATFYLIPKNMDDNAYLTWEQARIMQQAGMRFGSHTVDHADLNRLSDDRLRWELSESKQAIDVELGKPVTSFAFPYGYYARDYFPFLAKAGYKTAVTEDRGLATAQELFRIPRLIVDPKTDVPLLLSMVQKVMAW